MYGKIRFILIKYLTSIYIIGYHPDLFINCANLLMINDETSKNLSTQFVKQSSVFESSLVEGLAIHFSQQTSLKL